MYVRHTKVDVPAHDAGMDLEPPHRNCELQKLQQLGPNGRITANSLAYCSGFEL